MPIIKELQTFYSCKGNTFQPYFHPYPILIFYVKKPRTKVFLTLEFTKKAATRPQEHHHTMVTRPIMAHGSLANTL